MFNLIGIILLVINPSNHVNKSDVVMALGVCTIKLFTDIIVAVS